MLIYYQAVVSWALAFWFQSFTTGTLPWHGEDTHEYFERNVLHRVERFEENGSWDMVWSQALMLALVWLVTVGCLVGGIHSMGKVAYFTVMAPFLLMAVLLFRALSLDGIFVLAAWVREDPVVVVVVVVVVQRPCWSSSGTYCDSVNKCPPAGKGNAQFICT